MSVCPFADQSQRFDSSFPTQVYRGGPSKGVLHTTETGGWPGYSGGSMAPHFTVRVYLSERRVVIRQHFDTKRPSRALVDGPNPVQTNNDGTVQVELIGTCDKATADKAGYFYWPDAPAWVLDELAKLMRWIEADRGVRRVSTKRPWLPYPKSYGSANGQRMTIAEWDAFNGWCGHQHVPDGNDHGDPGDINITYLLQEADEVTPEDIKAIADETLTRPVQDINGADRTVGWAIGAILRDGQRQNLQLAAMSTALDVVSKAAGVDPAEIAAIVDKAVRDRLAMLAVVDNNSQAV